jgi:hypothetical protein
MYRGAFTFGSEMFRSFLKDEFVFYYYYFWDWIKIRTSMDTATSNGPSVSASDEMRMEQWWSDKWKRKTEVLGEKKLPLHHSVHHTPETG